MSQNITNRVLYLRQAIGLSRSDLFKRYGIPRGTIQNWESNRYPLSEKGAKRLCLAANAEGVTSSINWLRFGEGDPPKTSKINESTYKELSESIPEIKSELEFFKEQNNEAVELIVDEHHMEPLFQIGDIVAGVRYFNENIVKAHMRNCIIHTKDHGVILRLLKLTDIPDHYHLLSLNRMVDDITEMHHCQVVSAAPVLWHRRPQI